MAFRIPIISDIIDKIQQSKLSQNLTNSPELQAIALHLSQRPQQLAQPTPITMGFGATPNKVIATVPKAIPDFMGMLESQAFGAGRGALNDVVQKANFFSKLGSKISGIQSPNLPEDTLSNALIPNTSMSGIGQNFEKEYGQGARGIGNAAYNAAMMSALSQGMEGSPMMSQIQNPIYKAVAPMSQSASWLTKLAGQGITNIAGNLPYTAAAGMQEFAKPSSPYSKLLNNQISPLRAAGEVGADTLLSLLASSLFKRANPYTTANNPALQIEKPNVAYTPNENGEYTRVPSADFKAQIDQAQQGGAEARQRDIMRNALGDKNMLSEQEIAANEAIPQNAPGKPLMTKSDTEAPINQSFWDKLKKSFALPQGGESQGGYINFNAPVGGAAENAPRTVTLPTGQTVEVPADWSEADVNSRWSQLVPAPEENVPAAVKVAKESGVPITQSAYQDTAKVSKLIDDIVGNGSDEEKLRNIAAYANGVQADETLNDTQKNIRINAVIEAFKKKFPEIIGDNEDALRSILTSPASGAAQGAADNGFQATLDKLTAQREALNSQIKTLTDRGVPLTDPKIGELMKAMAKAQPTDVVNYNNIISDPSKIAENYKLLQGLGEQYPNEPFFQQHKGLNPGFINFGADVGGGEAPVPTPATPEEPQILKGASQYGAKPTPLDINQPEEIANPTPAPVPSKMKILQPSPGFEDKYDEISGLNADYKVYQNTPDSDPFKDEMRANMEKTYGRRLQELGIDLNNPDTKAVTKDIAAASSDNLYTTPLDLKTTRTGEIKDLGEYSSTGELTKKQLKQINVMGDAGSYSAAPTEGTANKLFKGEQASQLNEIAKNFKSEATKAIAEDKQSLEQNLEGVSDAIRQSTHGVGTDPANMTDLSYWRIGGSNLDRNFAKVYGDQYPEMYKSYVKPLYDSAGQYAKDTIADSQQIWDIVDQTGIKPGSPEAKAVMQFGEGKLSLEEIQSKYPDNWQGIVDADKGFRAYYDTKLQQVNDVIKQIYPDTWEEHVIPYRQDYYRHMWDYQTGWAGLQNILSNPASINPELIGASDYTQPKMKFLSFALKREGAKGFVEDPFTAAINYDKASNYAINVDPQIAKFRSLASDLADATNDASDNPGATNNFIQYLRRFSDDLAGKTSPYDRSAQEMLGRNVYRGIDWLNSRVKANTVMMNASSSLSQLANVPAGMADSGLENSATGFSQWVKQLFNGVQEDDPIAQSNFLTERYGDSAFDKFDTGMLKDVKKFANWMLTAPDEAGTKIIWNAEYAKALQNGEENAIDFADNATRNTVAGRGIGGVPLLQKARMTQMIAPFQVELNNSWLQMKDWVDEKQFGKIALYFALTHVFNAGYKAAFGRPVLFDPIQGIVDTVKEKAPLRLPGEVLGNLPFGQTAAQIYPQYGFKIPLTNIATPPKAKVFGNAPVRFGSSPLAISGLQDPLFKVLPPFGGGQIQKTLEGLKAYGEGAVKSPSGAVKFPIEQTPANLIRSLLFGQYATPAAQNYFDTNATPLGVNQSQQFNNKQDNAGAVKYYNQVQVQRTQKKTAAQKKAELDAKRKHNMGR
jgi:hypothetical protein